MKQLKKVAIGLGSNLGDRKKNILDAVQMLANEFLDEMRVSPLYETAPYGVTDQPAFFNAVVVGMSEWKPPAIVNYLKSVERELGRETVVKNGPRIIDLDLLVWDDAVWQSEGVVVPHPGLAERDFVLIPLQDVWPSFQHPVLKKTVSELLSSLQTQFVLSKVP